MSVLNTAFTSSPAWRRSSGVEGGERGANDGWLERGERGGENGVFGEHQPKRREWMEVGHKTAGFSGFPHGSQW